VEPEPVVEPVDVEPVDVEPLELELELLELELPEIEPLELVKGAAGLMRAPHPVRNTTSRRRTEYFIYSLRF
jgi:hypothetical protein